MTYSEWTERTYARIQAEVAGQPAPGKTVEVPGFGKDDGSVYVRIDPAEFDEDPT